jgi:hypothetical protein
MSKIKSMENALEFLAMNNEGLKKDLESIDDDLILNIIKSSFLSISDGKYTFNQEGIDAYCEEYGNNRKLNFLGI